jgi:1-acyl-sn-glycerol-3-phosphate acyltransferase
MLYILSRFYAYLVFKFRFKYKAHGRENIPKKGGVLVASNHASDLDPFAVGIGAFRFFNFMAKEELFENKIVGWWFRHINCFPVKREVGDKTAVEEAIKRLKEGKIVLLFPEGKRSPDGNLHAFQPGVGFLAQVTHVPILPVYIKGSYDAFPKGAKAYRPAQIKVYYGKPIVPRDNYDKAERKKVYEEIKKEVFQAVVDLKKNADENKAI